MLKDLLDGSIKDICLDDQQDVYVPVPTDMFLWAGGDAGTDVDENSDQRLVSPSIVLPSGAGAPVLKFWTRFDIEEDTATACYDGAILEVSTDGGSNWAQVANEDLLTLQYNGPVDDGFNNVLAGLDAWCDEQDWIQAVVDLSGFDGETLNFRYRLATDDSVGAGQWHIDDVSVQSCELAPGNLPFDDGFEEPLPPR